MIPAALSGKLLTGRTACPAAEFELDVVDAYSGPPRRSPGLFDARARRGGYRTVWSREPLSRYR